MDFNKNEAVNFKQTRDLIIELNLPGIVKRLYDGKNSVESLKNDFPNMNIMCIATLHDYDDPHAIFSLDKQQQQYYLVDRYKPFLSKGRTVIYAYDIISKNYVKYDIELFDEKTMEPTIWDGLFIEDIINLWSSEVSDDEIINYGKILEIKHIEKILEKIYELENSSIDFLYWEEKIKQMIKNIN